MASMMQKVAMCVSFATGIAAASVALAQQRSTCDYAAMAEAWERKQQLPRFRGCTFEEASAWFSRRHPAPIERIQQPDDELPAGIVTTQYPNPGDPEAYLEAGLRLTVSTGPRPVATPDVSINPATAVEAETLTFQVTLQRPPDSTETFRYRYVVRPRTAHEGEDYEPAAGELVFAPDRDTQPVPVATRPDADDAGERTLLLVVLAGDREFTGEGTITDRPPDPAPIVAIQDATATEGGSLRFRVSLDRPVQGAITYRYFVESGTAREGVDYRLAGSEVSFGPGETEKPIEIAAPTDGVADGEHVLTLVIVGEGGEEFRGTGTIADADLPGSTTPPGSNWTLRDWLVAGGVALAVLLLGAALVAISRYLRGARGKEAGEPVESEPAAAAPLPTADCVLLDGDPPAVEGEALPFSAPVMEIGVETENGAVDPMGPLPILKEEPTDEPAS